MSELKLAHQDRMEATCLALRLDDYITAANKIQKMLCPDDPYRVTVMNAITETRAKYEEAVAALVGAREQ